MTRYKIESMSELAHDVSLHEHSRGPNYTFSDFERILRQFEADYGFEATWNAVRNIILTTDNYRVGHALIRCCALREADESDQLRFQILIDVIHSDMDGLCKTPAIDDLDAFDHIRPSIDVMKELHGVVDDHTRAELALEIVRKDFVRTEMKECYGVMNILCIPTPRKPDDECVRAIHGEISRRGSDMVLAAVRYILNHEYATDASKRIAELFLREYEMGNTHLGSKIGK